MVHESTILYMLLQPVSHRHVYGKLKVLCLRGEKRKRLWSCRSVKKLFWPRGNIIFKAKEPCGHHQGCSGVMLGEGTAKLRSLLGRRRADTRLCTDWDTSGHWCRKTEKLGACNLLSVLLKKAIPVFLQTRIATSANFCTFIAEVVSQGTREVQGATPLAHYCQRP